MAFCQKCGKEIMDEEERPFNVYVLKDNNAEIRFALTFFLGFIGSFIINHTSLKPFGWKSRTCAYFFLGFFTCGIYTLIASLCNLSFNQLDEKNIGYFKD